MERARWGVPATLLLLGLLLVGTLGMGGAATGEDRNRKISVSGSAEVRVKPDEVQLDLGIETSDMKLNVAKQENDQRVSRILEIARQAGVEDKHIQTEYLNIEPRYRDVSNDPNPVFIGYWVRRTVAITLRDPSKFDALLSRVVEAGSNYVHGIEFRTTDLRKHRDQARDQAIRAARQKAEALAAALGAKLGVVENINESQPAGWWTSYNRWGQPTRRGGFMTQNVMQEAGGGDGAGTLAPGQVTVTAQVHVVFRLE